MSYNLVDPTTGDLTRVAGGIDTSIIPSDASASNKLVTNTQLTSKMSCYTWDTNKTLRAVFYEVTDRDIMPDVNDTVGKRVIARYGNVLINRITQLNGIKNFYWDNTLVLSCPYNDDTTKLTATLEIFVGTTSWQQLVTNDDIFLVGDRRNTIGWADLSNSVNIDGSSNFANNVGRIEGHNALIEVSNPSTGYQWPVTNSGNSNVFMDFGGAIQFFTDKVNNHLYVRFANSIDMSAWQELAFMDKVESKYIEENILTSTDWNTLNTKARYYFSGGTPMTNSPEEVPFGLLEVITVSTYCIIQRYFAFSSGKLYIRRWSGDSWNEWYRFDGIAI